MVFRWLRKLVGYLFSHLHKDAVLESKEKKLEKKEIKQVLNQEAIMEDIDRTHKDQIVQEQAVSKEVNELRADIELKANIVADDQRSRGTGEEKKTEIIAKINSLINSSFLKEFGKGLDDEKKFINKVGEENEKLTEEKRLIKKQLSNLRRSYKKEDISQEEKEASLKEKRKLIQEIIYLNAEIIEHTERFIQRKQEDLRELKIWKEKLEKFREDILAGKAKFKDVVPYLNDWDNKERARSLVNYSILNVYNLERINKKRALYKKIKKIDAMYDHFLMEEEIEVQEGV